MFDREKITQQEALYLVIGTKQSRERVSAYIDIIFYVMI